MVLEFENVSIDIASRAILKNVSFSLNSGEFVALVGQNGVGKTTLLRSIIKYIKPTSGIVKLIGSPLTEMSQRSVGNVLSYVPQSHHVLPDLLVSQFFENAFDPKDLKLIEDLEIKNFRDRRFLSLSGGERQRVLLASALARDPKLLLLDELTQYADISTTNFLGTFLSSHCHSKGLTILAVSHDSAWIEKFASRALLLKDGQIASIANGRSNAF